MDRRKLILLFHTLKHLKLKQVYYRAFYLIKTPFPIIRKRKQLKASELQINWSFDEILFENSYSKNTFYFLNRPKVFKEKIDWNFSDYGKLWTYNLNYFDFLNQKKINKNQGLQLIKDYINKTNQLKDGIEPYPISLRGINWIKFLSRNSVSDIEINQALYNHYQILLNNLEYHLLANHLLENSFSLLFGAYYFKDELLYKTALGILKEELEEQILEDGAHFELSPMYHQILLHRLLDSIALLEQNSWKEESLLIFLKAKASEMLSWLSIVTYKNGSIPMVNDSAYNIAPSSNKLFNYAKQLNIKWNLNNKLKDSGYRKHKNKVYEFFVDVGDIQPSYQPGHAHSDTFNFELYLREKPFIVDTGISTYEKNTLRQAERSTAAHNTIQIGDIEQSQVWGGFRVGRRARIISLEENETMIKAAHDGYIKKGIIHERTFIINTNSIIIKDNLSKEVNLSQKAYFHFHPDVKKINIKDHEVIVDNKTSIIFNGDLKIKQSEYDYAMGFNKTKKAQKAIVYFNKSLVTQINL